MKRIIVLAALALCAIGAFGIGGEGRFPVRWFFMARAVVEMEDVAFITNIVDKAASCGYNGMMLAGMDDVDIWPGWRRKRLEIVRRACEERNVELVPMIWTIGYCTMQSRDVNLAEGLGVSGIPYERRGNKAVFAPSGGGDVLRGDGGFEESSGNGPKALPRGWDAWDHVGTVVAMDGDVRHSGGKSMRLSRFDVADGGQARLLHKPISLRPNSQYAITGWVRASDDFAPRSAFRVQVSQNGNFFSISSVLPKTKSGEWVRFAVPILVQEEGPILLYVGTWEAKRGTVWVDDVRVEDIGICGVLRRAGCPFSVHDAVTGKEYEEGRDYGKVAPLASVRFSPGGKSLELQIPEGSRIPADGKLLVGGYVPITVKNGIQCSTCMSEPSLYGYFRKSAEGLKAALNPKTWFLSMDEIRMGGTCAACRARNTDMAHILGECVTRQHAIIKSIDPDARICIWSDMFNPAQNARDRIYYCKGSFAGSWRLIPHDIVMVDWYGAKYAESLPFWRKEGFSVIGASYYDAPMDTRSARDIAAMAAQPNTLGAVYTTWREDYRKLGEFSALLMSANGKDGMSMPQPSYWNGNEFPGATGGVEYAEGSLALRYDFSGGGRYVAARFDLARQPMARSLSFETLFEKGVALGIHVRDASGQNLLRRLEGTPDGDWCAVRISLEENWDGSWGGAKDRRLHLPIQRLEFAAERCGSVPGKGVLRVRNITLSDETFHEEDGIYPLPCRNAAPDELRRRTDTALAKLRQLVPQMEARGIGAKSRATLTVADRFGEWIETDLAHGLTNRAMRAARERTALAERGVERAQRILDGLETDFAVPRYRTGPVSAEHSQMIGTREHPDGRKDRGPVFLTGFGHFAMAQRDLELFPSLGCNILQMEIGPSHVFPSEGAINTHALDRFDSVAARAAKANVAVNLLLSPHYFPRWALEKWPHLAGCGGGFFKYCTYADEAKDLIKRYLQIVIPHIRGNPALHSVCLSNEPETHVYGGCPVLRREWPIWLRRRHGDIAALNREMATAYRSFEEVPMPAGSTGNARSRILAEFVRFNTEQFAKWHEWMADCIHGMAPEMQIHSKISVGGVFNDSDPILYSVDPEAFGAFSNFNGNDSSDYCAIFARVSRWSHGWWNMEAAYDWQRASNDKPIFNSENHIHRASRAEFVPGAHTRTVLWQNAIHGQAATTLWRWDRDFDDGKGQPIGLILERPECLEAWAHAALDISRLANVIASIQNLPPSILVCWQRPAVLEGRASTEDFFACYRSAAFLGQQVGIVTEDALADFGRTGVTRRPLDGARVLLFPSARDVPDSVSAGLKRFATSGGVVVYADCANERALAHRLAEESSSWPIPDHPFARDVAAGTPVYGVETRGVRCDGRAYIYMCNHLKVAQTVRLESDGVDLISGKPVAQVTSVPPLTPMLVELNGKGEKQ